MNKVISVLMVVLFVSALPLVYAHPETVGMYFTVDNVKYVINSGGTPVDDTVSSAELLSQQWAWDNFILLLSGGIALTMIGVVAVTFRYEITLKPIRIFDQRH